MKAFALFVVLFAAVFSSHSAPLTLEDISPHLSTNARIIWQAPTNLLPKSFWVYQRLPLRPFSATVISNAIVLASLQGKGFPKSSTNDFYITGDYPPNYPGMIPVIFNIMPKSATISYSRPNPGTNITDIPADNIVVRRAWACAVQLGVDPTQIEFKEMTSSFNLDENDNELTNQLCGRGVFLSRKLDGILFWSIGTDDSSFDGFSTELGSHGQIRAFSLVWPDLERVKLQATASPQQIVACIRAFKTMVLPNRNEQTYFERIKQVSKARKLIITKITPYYREGIYWEAPTNDEPPQLVTPIAEIEAIADFGSSNSSVALFAPITSADADRLLTDTSSK